MSQLLTGSFADWQHRRPTRRRPLAAEVTDHELFGFRIRARRVRPQGRAKKPSESCCNSEANSITLNPKPSVAPWAQLGGWQKKPTLNQLGGWQKKPSFLPLGPGELEEELPQEPRKLSVPPSHELQFPDLPTPQTHTYEGLWKMWVLGDGAPEGLREYSRSP